MKEFSKKIQTLLSYLANGEYSRGDFEPLHDGLFSMKIDLSNRFIFKIVMGNLNKGIEKICVDSAKGHDPKNLEKTAVKDFEFD